MRRICEDCGNSHDDEIHSTVCPHNGIGFCRKCDCVMCVCNPRVHYEIFSIGGNCPVQAEGRVNGRPFYFRARGEHWEFCVAATSDGDPLDFYISSPEYAASKGGFLYREDYKTTDQFAAGWMEVSEAREFIAKAAKLYAEREVAK